MLTQCSQCSTIYRVLAAQLAAANGFVACGDCGAIFNALNRLADETERPVSSSDRHGIGNRDESPSALPVGLSPKAPSVCASEEPIEVSSIPPSEPETKPPAPKFDLDDVPEILREDVARLMRRPRFSLSLLWSVLAFGALSILLAQIAWEYRATWGARYPMLVSHAELLCERIGCTFSPAPGVDGIELVARDVREHPQYAHALLVNATLANRSATVVAYPVIQLGVYDRNGGVVGVRRFAPTEYLDASIDIVGGLPAGRAVYVVLEIAGASDVADSFEFTFL